MAKGPSGKGDLPKIVRKCFRFSNHFWVSFPAPVYLSAPRGCTGTETLTADAATALPLIMAIGRHHHHPLNQGVGPESIPVL